MNFGEALPWILLGLVVGYAVSYVLALVLLWLINVIHPFDAPVWAVAALILFAHIFIKGATAK